MFRKEKGFTLIELLIVIAVIGILAAAILPRFIAFDTDAKEASTKGALSSLRAALVLYRAKEGGWPPDGTATALGAALVPAYIDAVPVCRVMTTVNNDIVIGTTFAESATSAWFYNTTNKTWQVARGGTDTAGKYYSDMAWY